MIAFRRGEASSSAGLGGSGPQGSSDRFSNSVSQHVLLRADRCWSAAWRGLRRGSRPVTKAGLRRSASISSTRLPSRAKFWASASVVRDLPSAARVLVISRLFGAPVSVVNWSERSKREIGFRDRRRSDPSVPRAAARCPSSVGITPSDARPSLSRTSSGVLIVSLRNSSAERGAKRRRARPSAEPDQQVEHQVRRIGAAGGSARSTTETVLVPMPPATPISL